MIKENFGDGDGIIIFPLQNDKTIVRPDEASQVNLKVESGMDKLYGYVMDAMKNCRVYVHFETDRSVFAADFLAVTETPGKDMHSGQYMTSWLSIGMDTEQVSREGDIIIKALATSLGVRIFVDDSPTISSEALVIKNITKR